MFTWVNFYKEFAEKLTNYIGNEKDLIRFLNSLDEKGLPVGSLMDNNGKTKMPLTNMDPFTFFSTFNRGVTESNRIEILKNIKSYFNVTAALPDDFTGIPVVDNRNSWFFPFEEIRKSDDSFNLWRLANSIVKDPIDRIDGELFDRCVQIENARFFKLTIGMFWLAPDKFLPLDANTRRYLKSEFGLSFDFDRNWANYKKTIEKVIEKCGSDFPKISYEAYKAIKDSEPQEEAEAEVSERRSWIFQGNPKYYDVVRALNELKTIEWLTSQAYQKIKKDDAVYFWISGKTGGLAGRGVVIEEPRFGSFPAEELKFVKDEAVMLKSERRSCRIKIDEVFESILSKEEIQRDQLLKNLPIFSFANATNFELTPEFSRRIEKLLAARKSSPGKVENKYSVDDALKELFMDEKNLKELLSVFEDKKCLILEGPPGTGKTFLAKRLAWLLNGSQSEDTNQLIQFHQSFSYEDFMEGLKPNSNGVFVLKKGKFLEFAKSAEKNPDKKFTLIIDEINRGNVSKIFGEALLGLEVDKRDKRYAIDLTYSEEDFVIPLNLYLIGTMNTADRSLSMLDYALRRRFSFWKLVPRFDDPLFSKNLQENGVSDELITKIINKLKNLNEMIDKDLNGFGKGSQIGHSFFCLNSKNKPNDFSEKEWFERVVKYQIRPYLDEYWFDDPEKVDKQIEILLK